MVVESLAPLFCLMDLLYHFCLIFSIFPSSSSELNSKSIFGSTTIKTYTKQLSAESDYVTLAEISASSNDIIIVKTRWLSGKPTGVKILDKDSQTLYAINEDDTGYINLFFSPTAIRQTHSLIVQVKNLNPDGLSGIDLIQIHFEQK